MEIKKSPKANLESKKLLFREIGLIVTLAIVYFAFEWSTTEKAETFADAQTTVIEEEEMVPITQETPPPPPEPPKEPQLSDIIDIVDNEVTIEEDFDWSTEDDENVGVEIKEYVPEEVVEEVIEEEIIPLAVIEEQPEFQGKKRGQTFQDWVYSELVYPEIAKENGISGRVTLTFIINKDGSVSDVRILRGVDSSLDKEAIRVVSSSPKWKPGKQRGKPVKVRYDFPIIFQLR